MSRPFPPSALLAFTLWLEALTALCAQLASVVPPRAPPHQLAALATTHRKVQPTVASVRWDTTAQLTLRLHWHAPQAPGLLKGLRNAQPVLLDHSVQAQRFQLLWPVPQDSIAACLT